MLTFAYKTSDFFFAFGHDNQTKMLKPKNIYSVLKPMFYSTKITGLSPFNLNETKCNRSSILDLIWSISIMFFLVGISFFSLNTRETHSAIITKITDYLHTRLCVTSLCGGIFFACFFRRKIMAVVKEISVTDKELKLLNLNFDMNVKYRKSKIYLIISTCTLWVYISGLFILDIAAFTSVDLVSIGQIFAYAGPLLTTFVELQFCAFVLLLKERFAWLNNKMSGLSKYFCRNTRYKSRKRVCFSKISPVYTQTPKTIYKEDQTLTTLQQISIHHHRLCTISQNLNKAYSFQILLIVVQAFMTVIAVSFYLARLTFSNTLKLMPVIQQLYYFNMLILHLAVIIVLVVICSNAAKEAQKTGIILHNVVSTNTFVNEGYLDLGVVCFSLQLLHHNVKFTACKLFIIDETLLYSIAGAATTYLVIVLQFEFGVSAGENQNTQSLNCTIK